MANQKTQNDSEYKSKKKKFATKTHDNQSHKSQTISIVGVFKYAESSHYKLLISGIIAAILGSLSLPLFIFVFGKLIDVFVEYENARSTEQNPEVLEEMNRKLMKSVYFYCSLFGVSWFVYAFGRYSILHTMQLFSLRYSGRLKQLYFRSILSQEIAWFDTQKSGEFASRISNDFKKFESGINENLAMIFTIIGSAVSNSTISIYYGWQLALILLTCVPVIGIGMHLSNRFLNRYSKIETQAFADASAIAEESISAIRTVKAFSGNDRERTRYNEKLKVGFRNAFKRNLASAFNTAFDWGILYTFLGIGVYYGVRMISDGVPGYTIGVFTMVFWSTVTVGYNCGEIAPYLEAFNVCRSVAVGLFDVIDRNSKINSLDDTGSELQNDFQPEIEFRNVTFRYPSRDEVTVLKNFNLKISAGETVALVGSSGCGKSTLLQLLQRFYEPCAGGVCLNGQSLREFNLGWLRTQMGIVQQEPVLFDDTIEMNIRLGRPDFDSVTIEEVQAAARQANAESFIKNLQNQLQTYVGDRGAQLSGGQKQRIAIARALIASPKILLLDEATSALDLQSERLVQTALDRASKSRTTIVIAHRLSTIKNVDRIIVMKDGDIVEEGNHNDLMAKESFYYRMVNAQQVLVSPESETHLGFEETTESEEIPEETTSTVSDEQVEAASKVPLVSYRKIFSLFWKDKSIFILGLICALAFGLGTPIYALIYGGLLEEFNSEHNDPATLLERCQKYVYEFIGLGLGKFVTCFLQILAFGYLGEKLTFNLRKNVFDSVLQQDVCWFDMKVNSPGKLCARISDDAANIQAASGLRIATMFQVASTLIITVPLGFWYNWKMATLSLVLMPLIFAAYTVSTQLSKHQAKNEAETSKNASQVVIQVTNSIRTVVSLNRQQYFYDKFCSNIRTHTEKMKSHIFKKSVFYGMSMGISVASYGGAFLFGGYLIKERMISVADLYRIIESMIYGAIVVGQTSVLSADFAKARQAIANMLKLIELKSSSPPEVVVVSPASRAKGDVELQQVHFEYESRPGQAVLNGLSFKAKQGETVALVGSSGCGKSTTIQLLEQFYKPTQGQILIDGRSDFGSEWARRQMALVAQEPVLFSCSIGENIAYGDTSRTVSEKEILEAAQAANIAQFIEKLPEGYDTQVGQRGVQLSGGQKQRIAIARALVRDPAILLLDEATSALDTESEKIVQNALDDASRGRTCLVVAHRLKTIVNAHRIIVLDRGQAVEEGTHEELLQKRGFYWKLFNLN